MKNKIAALVICAILLLSAFAMIIPIATTTANATGGGTTDGIEKTVINVYYFRFDKEYTKWNMWMWTADEVGKDYYFSPADDMVKTTVTYNYNATASIIIRYDGAWEQKEPGGDRTIDGQYTISKDGKSKSIDVYVVQGDTNLYYSRDDFNTDPRPKLVKAKLESVKNNGVTEKVTMISVDLFGSFKDVNSFTLWKVGLDGQQTQVELRKITPVGSKGVKLYLPWDEVYDIVGTYVVKWSEYNTETTVILDGAFYMTEEYNDNHTYNGQLGAIWDSHQTVFRLWAPEAYSVKLNIYDKGNGGTLQEEQNMVLGEGGVWSYTADGDYNGKYYTYEVRDAMHPNPGESVDPYAVSVGVNGNRGMILDLSTTNPEGWENHSIPTTTVRDAVIYEAHIRDMTIDESSGVSAENRGKYLGLTETGTTNASGQSTALDHLVELGVNYFHILPSYDYASVDEENTAPQFNWGYDPKNYNAPEGSYSTNPYDGAVRVSEYKQMVQALHENGIKVIMDVVYNHTFASDNSWFNQIYYGYYYRMLSTGGFSNGSGCGNETASEHTMMQKFMIDSVVHWATEYKLDGFRFDLMGLHDIETMNMIAEALREVNPDILIYGEGWDAGGSGLDKSEAALKANALQLDDIGVFNDDMRDGIKGSVFTKSAKGYVSGANGKENPVLIGTVGAVTGAKSIGIYGGGYTVNPTQCINYVSAHDNNTLWDKLSISNGTNSYEERTKMNMMSATLVLTGQGIPFFLNGEEMRREKTNADGTPNENSYNAPDSVNAIDWDKKDDNLDLFNFYKGLIEWRTANSQFFYDTGAEVLANTEILSKENNVIGYKFTTDEQSAIVYTNANTEAVDITLPEGKWSVNVTNGVAGTTVLSTVSGKITLEAQSYIVATSGVEEGKEPLSTGAIVAISSGSAAVAGGGTATGIAIAKGKIRLPFRKRKL